MKSLHASSARSQRGSVYTTIFLVALFGFVILAVLRVAPAYIDDRTLVDTMNGVVESGEFEDMSLSDVRNNLMRTLNVNRVDFDANKVVLTKEGGKEYVDINYESRKPLFYNIEAVVIFQHRFEKN
ncbi:MAG: hypothetical protein RLZZ227_2837 [Pseudomonadota bacterium]|jgi:hypothetical protein